MGEFTRDEIERAYAHYRQTAAEAGASGDWDPWADLFTEEYLQERPILRCVRGANGSPAVLLIDEIDRADDEFEALLLEFLGEASVTVPELGTFVAEQPPIVVLTSNRSRDLHDAMRRRCLYHWIDFPAPDRAAEILRRSVPSASESLIQSATQFVGRARDLDLEPFALFDGIGKTPQLGDELGVRINLLDIPVVHGCPSMSR